jgi:indolepyruvate ferredoxin oxidoreductase beta subunit
VSRLRAEQEIPEDGLVRVTEYFHPRVEEVLATLPRGLSRWLAHRAWMLGLLRSVFSRGRRIRSDRMSGYLLLWAVAGLRKWRRVLQRHSVEMAHLDALCARAAACLPDSPVLAAELFACQRLIKGYSDTHARGQSKFDKVMHGADKVSGRADAADWVRRLRVAALQDVEGTALDAALETIASFAPDKPVV